MSSAALAAERRMLSRARSRVVDPFVADLVARARTGEEVRAALRMYRVLSVDSRTVAWMRRVSSRLLGRYLALLRRAVEEAHNYLLPRGPKEYEELSREVVDRVAWLAKWYAEADRVLRGDWRVLAKYLPIRSAVHLGSGVYKAVTNTGDEVLIDAAAAYRRAEAVLDPSATPAFLVEELASRTRRLRFGNIAVRDEGDHAVITINEDEHRVRWGDIATAYSLLIRGSDKHGLHVVSPLLLWDSPEYASIIAFRSMARRHGVKYPRVWQPVLTDAVAVERVGGVYIGVTPDGRYKVPTSSTEAPIANSREEAYINAVYVAATMNPRLFKATVSAVRNRVKVPEKVLKLAAVAQALRRYHVMIEAPGRYSLMANIEIMSADDIPKPGLLPIIGPRIVKPKDIIVHTYWGKVRYDKYNGGFSDAAVVSTRRAEYPPEFAEIARRFGATRFIEWSEGKGDDREYKIAFIVNGVAIVASSIG